MYTRCVIPGCDVPFDRCEIHHVRPWARDLGPTDLADLAPVCAHDHHRIHEGGWRLELAHDSARTIMLVRPDGSTEYAGPSIQRRRRAA